MTDRTAVTAEARSRVADGAGSSVHLRRHDLNERARMRSGEGAGRVREVKQRLSPLSSPAAAMMPMPSV